MNPWFVLVIAVALVIALLVFTLPNRSAYLTDMSESPTPELEMPQQSIANTKSVAQPTTVEKAATVERLKTAETPTPEIESLLSELIEYKTCYVEDSCVIPQSDTRGAHFFVAQQLTQRLRRLVEFAHQGAPDAGPLTDTARVFLGFPDGYVQEQALLLMGTMPPAEGNAEAIIGVLKDHHDANLFELALVELQRYPNAYRIIDDFLIETLKTGGHYASQAVARQLLPILREDNINRYETIAGELPQDTAKARYLKQVLNEYRLLQQDG